MPGQYQGCKTIAMVLSFRNGCISMRDGPHHVAQGRICSQGFVLCLSPPKLCMCSPHGLLQHASRAVLGLGIATVLEVTAYIVRYLGSTNNQGAIFLATNPAQEQWSKHIGIRYHYIRECVEEGDKIDLFYIPTGEQIADIFTKNLSLVKFEDIRKGLRMISYSS